MSNLTPYTTGGLLPRDARTTGHGLSRLTSQSTLAIARVEATADIQASKVEAASQVAARAMSAVALVTQLEGQLAQTVPLAASRLQAIGDMGALAAADVVADTTWKLKRC